MPQALHFASATQWSSKSSRVVIASSSRIHKPPLEYEKQLLSIWTGAGCFLKEALTYSSALQQVHAYVKCILDTAHLAGSTRFHIGVSVRLHQLHYNAENQL